MRSRLGSVFLVVGLTIGTATAAYGQSGSITGTVRSEAGQVLSGAQVYIVGTTIGQITNQEGRFLLQGVPPGRHTVAVQLLGYTEGRQANVEVLPGQTATVNFELTESVLALEELRVTGTADPIAGVKSPMSISVVTKENVATVPTINSAAASIQGKVAGASIIRGSGQPGTGVSVLLRTPTTVYGTNSPLFVVDGVILADIGTTTRDLESLDIENVEVIKGAAAASLYGSRAAGGVISITTSRGRTGQIDQTRITARSEIGIESIPKMIPLSNSHQFLQNEQGEWLDRDGNVVSRTLRVVDADNIMDNPFRGPTYDNLNNFFRSAQFQQHQVNLSYFSQSTNFLTSATYYDQRGALEANNGIQRMNFRANLDHRLRDDFSLSLSASHSRYTRDLISQGGGGEGGIFWDLLLFPPDVDLGKKDANGEFLLQPDSTIILANPLWSEQLLEETDWRARTLASIDARFNPTSWLNISGNIAYDRSDEHYEFYRAKGTPTSLTADVPSDGDLNKQNDYADALNASVTSSILKNFGLLSTRTTLRGLLERQKNKAFSASGDDFWVIDVRDLDVAATVAIGSSESEIRSSAYMIEENIDYDGKYIGSFLVRRDGSSLFGSRERWHTYYRTAGAWRMSRESWWPFENLTEFKLRYSRGTAGGRPSFSAQYETWNVSNSGAVSKNTLGNRDLRPEHTTEQEFGVDMILANKYSLELTYAKQRTTDQIIALPLPAMVGYGSRWFNAGIVSGHTYEATFQAQLINQPNFTWNTTIVADRSRSRIDRWDRACFFSGLQNICDGASLSEMWGESFYRNLDPIRTKHPNAVDQFQVNDDGYVVWVGQGNSYRDGLSKNLWGTSGEVDGVVYQWGMPVKDVDDQGFPVISQIGRSDPDFQIGWLNNLNWRGINIHTQFHAQIGGNVYNGTKQRMHQHERHGDLDQAGKADELKKTIAYYQALYNANVNTNHFVEDGSYLKLREIALQYRFNRQQLSKIGLGRVAENLVVGVIGRNLWTLTGYSGFDPEVGSVLERRDTFAFPNPRTLTLNFEVVF